jgi:hypothetical protein
MAFVWPAFICCNIVVLYMMKNSYLKLGNMIVVVTSIWQ